MYSCNALDFTFFKYISKFLFFFLILSFITELNFDVVNPKYEKYPMNIINNVNIIINVLNKFLII